MPVDERDDSPLISQSNAYWSQTFAGPTCCIPRHLPSADDEGEVGDRSNPRPATGDGSRRHRPADFPVAALRRVAADHPIERVTATDGNHGRAVGRRGGRLGLPVRVLLPHGTPAGARAAIAAEGAAVSHEI
ncbi:MAG: hypothetical protein DLM59_01975 [Pseudonocardiales bacterium]|nr:MAG: hypothetical protein DLM59_01975 [Pseudonocardiales bacterium]